MIVISHQYSGTIINMLNTQNGLAIHQRDLIFNRICQYPDNTQMAIAFIQDNTCVFYGAIKQNDTVKPLDNKHSVFEIGSITKIFTATLLANFFLDNIITPDRNINDDLDFTLNNNIKICYKDLVDHTSGLPRRPSNMFFCVLRSPLNPYKYYSTGKLEKYLKNRLKLIHKGGSKYKYSNLGFGLLGYMLCRLANSDYESLLKDKIFSKYGLSYTTTIKENEKDILVAGLGPFGNKTPGWDLASLEGAGNIISSVYDLSKFVMAQFDTSNLELTLTRQSTFIISENKEIGLGWHILKDKSENNWYWHNGGTGGYRSAVVFDTDNKKGIIILTNISIGHRKSDQIDEFCFDLMKSL